MVTLKGCTVVRLYPRPEFRKTTHIDLFVADLEAADWVIRILGANRFHPSKVVKLCYELCRIIIS